MPSVELRRSSGTTPGTLSTNWQDRSVKMCTLASVSSQKHRHSKSMCQRLPFVSLHSKAINSFPLTVCNARTHAVVASMTSHLSKGERHPSGTVWWCFLPWTLDCCDAGYPIALFASIHPNPHVHTHVLDGKPLFVHPCGDRHSSQPYCLLSSFGVVVSVTMGSSQSSMNARRSLSSFFSGCSSTDELLFKWNAPLDEAFLEKENSEVLCIKAAAKLRLRNGSSVGCDCLRCAKRMLMHRGRKRKRSSSSVTTGPWCWADSRTST